MRYGRDGRCPSDDRTCHLGGSTDRVDYDLTLGRCCHMCCRVVQRCIGRSVDHCRSRCRRCMTRSWVEGVGVPSVLILRWGSCSHGVGGLSDDRCGRSRTSLSIVPSPCTSTGCLLQSHPCSDDLSLPFRTSDSAQGRLGFPFSGEPGRGH